MNWLKTTIFMAALTALLVVAGGALGGRTGMTFALMLAIGLNFFSYWFSDKVVLRMYRAQEVTESQAPELFMMVRRLAGRAGIPIPKVYIINQPQPNAFATGRNPSHAAVAVTAGIMDILNREELEGVIAHELAHVRNRDILIGTIAATIAGAISYLASIAQWGLIFGGHDEDDNPLAAIAMIIIAPIAAVLVQLAISRSREYAADATGARIAGSAMPLASALAKLEAASHQVPLQANPATAHMFIMNPLRGGQMARLFSTHPPVEERITRLKGMGPVGSV